MTWVALTASALAVALAGCSSDQADTATTAGGTATTAGATATTQASARLVSEGELQAFADRLVDQSGADGGIVAWRVGDDDPVVVTSGVADGSSGQRIRPRDSFHIASITKSFVAAAAVLLAADGQLDLDDPISDHVDWPGGDDITVRQLLDQTSGVAPFGNNGDTDEAQRRYLDLLSQGGAITLDESLAAARDLPPVDRPGRSATYSNTNYDLAAAVIEAATDQDIDTVLQERLFDPLGMEDTWYPPQTEGDTDPLPGLDEIDPAQDPLPTSLEDMEAHRTVTAPAAGAVSTLDDLYRWSDAILRDQTIEEVDVSAMSEIQPGGYGLGVVGVTEDGACVFDGCPPGQQYTRLALQGDIAGSSTRLLYDPATDTTLFVYLNRNHLELDGPMLDFLRGPA